jgi:hypothetical protein
MDFLHCALVAILVLLAIYCFRSFREGIYHVSMINPSYPNMCFNGTVSGQGEKQAIRWFSPSNPTAQAYESGIATCQERGFTSKGWKMSKPLGPIFVFGRMIEKHWPHVKVDASPQVWNK